MSLKANRPSLVGLTNKPVHKGFVPVLFSDTYTDILGFKAVRLEKVEASIYSQGEN
jgi:hypothetical protein